MRIVLPCRDNLFLRILSSCEPRSKVKKSSVPIMIRLVLFLVLLAVVLQAAPGFPPEASLVVPRGLTRRSSDRRALLTETSSHNTTRSSSSSSTGLPSTTLTYTHINTSSFSTGPSSRRPTSAPPGLLPSSTGPSSTTSAITSSSFSSTSGIPTYLITPAPTASLKPTTTYTVSHGKTYDSDIIGGFFIFGGLGGGALAFPSLFDDIVFLIPEGALELVKEGEDGKPETTTETATEPTTEPTTKTLTTSSDSSGCAMKTGYDYWVECYSTASGQSMSCTTTRTSMTAVCSPTTTAITTTVVPACGPLDLSEEDYEGEDGGCDANIPCDEPYCYGTVAAPTGGTGPGASVSGTCQQVLTGCSCTPSDLTPGFCSSYITSCSSPICNGKSVLGKWICTGLFAGCSCSPTQNPPTISNSTTQSTTSNSTTMTPTPLITSNYITMTKTPPTQNQPKQNRPVSNQNPPIQNPSTTSTQSITSNSTVTATAAPTTSGYDLTATATSFTTPSNPTEMASFTTYAFAAETAGIGCGDVAYYDFLQADSITTEQCFDFCSADGNYSSRNQLTISLLLTTISKVNCQAVFLQCSESNLCICNKYEKSYPSSNGTSYLHM